MYGNRLCFLFLRKFKSWGCSSKRLFYFWLTGSWGHSHFITKGFFLRTCERDLIDLCWILTFSITNPQFTSIVLSPSVLPAHPLVLFHHSLFPTSTSVPRVYTCSNSIWKKHILNILMLQISWKTTQLKKQKQM